MFHLYVDGLEITEPADFVRPLIETLDRYARDTSFVRAEIVWENEDNVSSEV